MLFNFKTLTPIALTLGLITLATPAQTQQNTLNFLWEMEGDVKIKSAWWKGYKQAEALSELYPSDQLHLEKGAYVEVYCNNNSSWYPIAPGIYKVSDGCPSTREVERQALINPQQTQYPTVPHLITPRNTKIITNKPKLRWSPVEGTTSYQVAIMGNGFSWQTEVAETEVVYSGEIPLQPGNTYDVIVTADNGGVFRGQTPVTFSLLEEEMARVSKEVKQLQQQPLKEERKALALAYLYDRNGLQAEAIDVLTELVEGGNKIAAVHLLLAEFYQDVGLDLLAEEEYLKTLELAKEENNWEVQGVSQINLGMMQEYLYDLDLAIEFYEGALFNYRVLGDEEKIEELKQKLARLRGGRKGNKTN